MLSKICIVFGILLSLFLPLHASCIFDSQEENCQIYYSTPTEVSLVQDSSVEYSDVIIYNTKTPQLEYDVIQESQNSYSLKNPIIDSGEYIAFAQGYDKYNEQIASSSSSVFVNLYAPKQPILPSLITTSSISGRAQFSSDTIVARDVNGNLLAEAQVGDDLLFTIEVNLNSPSFVEFVSVSPNGLESAPLRRYVYASNIPQQAISSIESFDFDENSIEKANSIINKITFERNFFISGTAIANQGTIFYLNGQKVAIIDNSFGHFIELNVGENIIEARSRSGEILDSYQVTYDNTLFSFQELNTQKVFQNSFTISGKTTLRKDFAVFVDGEYISEIYPQGDNTFSFSGSSQNKKVIVEFFGQDNAYEVFTLYKDEESPRIISHNHVKQVSPSTLLFSIEDDVGIDYSSITLQYGTSSQQPSERFGNYVVFDISQYEGDSIEYTITAEDLVGKTYSGGESISFSDQSQLDIMIQPQSSETKVYGKKLFSKNNQVDINLKTNGAIAFKHIYVDGVDHTSYSIISKEKVELYDITLPNSQGEITFHYVDSENRDYQKTYEYNVEQNKVQVIIDSMTQISRGNSNLPETYVKVSGIINHSLFDWNTFTINNALPSFFTSNNYFEAYVNVEEKDISFTGTSIVGNSIATPRLNDKVSLDTSTPQITLEKNNVSLSGLIQSSFIGYEEIISYQNVDYKRTYLEDQFSLPLEQRPGLQKISLKARNQFSQEPYEVSINEINDYLAPQVYSIVNDNMLEIHIDGTHSEIISASIDDIEGNSVSSSSCTPYFLGGRCLSVQPGEYLVETKDNQGNTYSNSPLSISTFEDLVSFEKIYLHGNDFYTTQKETSISGTIVSNKKVVSVSIPTKGDCLFDGVNFICEFETGIGDQEYSIELTYEDDSTTIIEEPPIVIVRPGENPLEFEVTLESGVSQFGESYYFFDDEIIALASLNSGASLSYFINGEKIIYGDIDSGETSVLIDLSSQIQGRDRAKLEVLFRAENEDIKDTSLFTLIYDKSKELLLDIFIS